MFEDYNQNQFPNSNIQKAILPWKFLVLIVFLSVSSAAIVSGLLIMKSGLSRPMTGIEEKDKFNISGTIINKNEETAKISAQIIKKHLDAMFIAGIAYSNNQRLVRFINEHKWDEAINSVSGLLREDFNGKKGAESIFLTDISGNLKANLPKIPEVSSKNFAFQDWYKGVTKNFKPYLSEVYKITAKPQFNVISFAFPVKDQNGTPIATLVIQNKSDAFLEWIYM